MTRKTSPDGAGRTRASIRDVARLAGVSPTTVSHALGGKRPVAQATRTRVVEAAERLGYRPHPGARSLKSRGTGVLALCMTNVTGATTPIGEMEYYFRLVNSAAATSVDSGFALVVVPDTDEGEFWDRLLLDGAIVADPVPDDANLRLLRARGLPVVTVGREPESPAEGYWVDADPEAATRLSLDHLAERGAADITAVTWLTSDYWTQASLRTYHAWCQEHGFAARVEAVLEDSFEGLRETASRVLSSGTRPDAVYGLFEQPALYLLDAAATLRIDVPGELMVASVSDFGLGPTTSPPMTTLDYHPEIHGRQAVEMLIDLVRGVTPPEPHRIVPVSLVERESTRRR